MHPVFGLSAHNPQEGDDAPRDYENDPDFLHLNLERYAAALRRDWPEITFADPGHWGLDWTLAPQGMRGRCGAVGHFVQIMPGGTHTAAFVLWHRGQIEERYALYLSRAPERACHRIESDTPLASIDEWLEWSSALFYRQNPPG